MTPLFMDGCRLSFKFSGVWLLFGVLGLLFCDKVSLCCPGCPGTHQAGLKLSDPSVSVSQGLGLKACTMVPGLAVFEADLL